MKHDFQKSAKEGFFFFLSLLLGATSFVQSCLADEIVSLDPKICLGALVDGGSLKRSLPPDGNCPPHHAIYGAWHHAKRWTPPKQIPIQAVCCELPAKDILLDEHRIEESRCPEDYVATGSSSWWGEKVLDKDLNAARRTHLLRCTKINTARYQLGESIPGILWGSSSNEWHDPRRINWAEIPAALRYAMGRVSRYWWQSSGCIGYPFGSLLAEKKSKYCSGLLFRTLYLKETKQKSGEAQAVTMYPDCSAVQDYFSAYPRCIK